MNKMEWKPKNHSGESRTCLNLSSSCILRKHLVIFVGTSTPIRGTGGNITSQCSSRTYLYRSSTTINISMSSRCPLNKLKSLIMQKRLIDPHHCWLSRNKGPTWELLRITDLGSNHSMQLQTLT